MLVSAWLQIEPILGASMAELAVTAKVACELTAIAVKAPISLKVEGIMLPHPYCKAPFCETAGGVGAKDLGEFCRF
jgi:hypothetical protein